jgi:phosphatidylethanolamine/phosphatidyl-N-methylethanolamine N-methyltransferase
MAGYPGPDEWPVALTSLLFTAWRSSGRPWRHGGELHPGYGPVSPRRVRPVEAGADSLCSVGLDNQCRMRYTSRMLSRDGLHFIKGALRSPIYVGAVAPSSPALARLMLRGLNLSDGAAVLELGPGTGPITTQIQRILPCPSRYLGIERDPQFIKVLVERFPAMRFVHGSAEQASRHLREAGMDNLKAIICGLPFASLPRGVQDGILENLEELMKPGVVFRTFQYLHALAMPSAVRFRRKMRQRFGPASMSRPVLLNLPPAVVLSWRR